MRTGLEPHGVRPGTASRALGDGRAPRRGRLLLAARTGGRTVDAPGEVVDRTDRRNHAKTGTVATIWSERETGIEPATLSEERETARATVGRERQEAGRRCGSRGRRIAPLRTPSRSRATTVRRRPGPTRPSPFRRMPEIAGQADRDNQRQTPSPYAKRSASARDAWPQMRSPSGPSARFLICCARGSRSAGARSTGTAPRDRVVGKPKGGTLDVGQPRVAGDRTRRPVGALPHVRRRKRPPWRSLRGG